MRSPYHVRLGKKLTVDHGGVTLGCEDRQTKNLCISMLKKISAYLCFGRKLGSLNIYYFPDRVSEDLFSEKLLFTPV